MTTTTTTTTTDVRTLIADNFGLVHWAARRATKQTRGRLGFDDAASEVSMLALRYARKYDPARGKFGTWLAQLARSAAAKFQTERTRACRDERRERGGLDVIGLMAADTPDPAGQFGDEPDDTCRRLRAALGPLRERDRRILVERFGLDGQGGRTLQELDPATSREASRQRLMHALLRLRDVLDPPRPDVSPDAPEAEPLTDGRVLAALVLAGEAVRVADLAGQLGHPEPAVRAALLRLRSAGKVVEVRGRRVRAVAVADPVEAACARVLDVLRKADGPVPSRDLAAAAGVDYGQFRPVVVRLVWGGEVEQTNRGYVLAGVHNGGPSRQGVVFGGFGGSFCESAPCRADRSAGSDELPVGIERLKSGSFRATRAKRINGQRVRESRTFPTIAEAVRWRETPAGEAVGVG